MWGCERGETRGAGKGKGGRDVRCYSRLVLLPVVVTDITICHSSSSTPLSSPSFSDSSCLSSSLEAIQSYLKPNFDINSSICKGINTRAAMHDGEGRKGRERWRGRGGGGGGG